MNRPGSAGGATQREGFTLLELLVAMALFALISLAGFALLNGIIGTRDRLDGRLARVAELQRGLYLMTLDLESMTPDPVEASADTIAFRRVSPAISPAAGQGSMPIRYVVKNHGLRREAGGAADQLLVSDVSGVRWRVLDATGVWREGAPPPAIPGGIAMERPRAVEVTLVLSGGRGGLAGPLRRVIELPRQP